MQTVLETDIEREQLLQEQERISNDEKADAKKLIQIYKRLE